MTREISIHAPRVGSDHVATNIAFLLEIFQSTLPVWGATFRPPPRQPGAGGEFQSTLPVWGATTGNWRSQL